MRSGTKDLLTGLAAIVALGGMATLLLGYGELADLFERTRRLDVRLDDGGGLRPGSTVTLNGVPVGKVAEVVVDTSRSADLPVFVEVRIDESTRLPATIVAEVRSKLFGGGADLVLRIPPPFDGPRLNSIVSIKIDVLFPLEPQNFAVQRGAECSPLGSIHTRQHEVIIAILGQCQRETQLFIPLGRRPDKHLPPLPEGTLLKLRRGRP